MLERERALIIGHFDVNQVHIAVLSAGQKQIGIVGMKADLVYGSLVVASGHVEAELGGRDNHAVYVAGGAAAGDQVLFEPRPAYVHDAELTVDDVAYRVHEESVFADR